LVVTPEADSLPLEIGGVDFRPANSGAYLPESDLPKIKSVFWHNNIIAFAPILETSVTIEETPPQNKDIAGLASALTSRNGISHPAPSLTNLRLIGTWVQHSFSLPDGSNFVTGIEKTNPWWRVQGRWLAGAANECVVGANLAKRLGLKIGSKLEVIEEKEGTDVVGTKTLDIVGVSESGGSEDDAALVPLSLVQALAHKPGQYRKLYVSALTKPEDDFARRDPKTMKPDELERWSCSPYVSSIAYSIKQALPGSDVRVIRRVADGEGKILTRVRTLLWLVTFTSLLAAALAVGASSASSVIERRTEIGLMKALGAGCSTVGWLLVAEQLLLAFVGGCTGYALGLLLARFLGTKIFGVPPEPSLLVLGVILVLAAAVTLLGSALPLRRAARFDPAPILRGE
jgi:putative ABC transport system permease protein